MSIPITCSACGGAFTPTRKGHIFCTRTACKTSRAKVRSENFRQANPTYGTQASRKRRAALRAQGAPTHQWEVKKANKQFVIDFKTNNPCTDCGNHFPYVCMDFDHVRGSKVNNVGTMVSNGWSRDAIEAEIAKCDLVCANCHRIRTHNRRSA